MIERVINKEVDFEGDVIFLDTETNGLDPHKFRIWSVQLTDGKTSLLATDFWNLLPYLKDELAGKTVVAHNASFDLKVLWKLGIHPEDVYCTMNAEKVIMAGKAFSFSLKDTLNRRKIATLSKEEREVFYDGTFDNRVDPSFFGSPESAWEPVDIDYALSDIEYLPELYRQQREEIRDAHLEKLVKLENAYVKSAAAIEWEGIRFDVDEAEVFAQELIPIREEMRSKVNFELSASYSRAAILEYNRKKEIWDRWEEIWKPIRHSRKHDEEKKRLKEIKPFKAKPKAPKEFNIASPMQLKLALRGKDIFTDSTSHDTLVELIDHQVVADLLEWREYEKLTQLLTTVRDSVNEFTGRIHPHVNQNIVSGRQSMSDPNLQQIPNRSEHAPRFRRLFRASKGNVLVVADYPAFELIYLGVASKDSNLLYALSQVEDLHAFTMSKFLGIPYTVIVRAKDGKQTDADLEELIPARNRFEAEFNIPALEELESISEWINKFRAIVKTMTYGLSYGLTAFGVARKFGCSPEAGEQLVNTFFQAYPDLKAFLNEAGNYAERHFRTPATRFGRRRHFQKLFAPSLAYETAKFSEAGFDSEEAFQFGMQEYNIKKREYRQAINRMRRQSGNFLPQGTNADATKMASVLFHKQFKPGKSPVRIVLSVHDELVVEAPKSRAEEARLVLKESMEKAADYCLNAPGVIKVQPKITERWTK